MKNIVICCDGTSNDISGAPTNVLRFYRSLERNDSQLAYYDSGVGTIPDPSMLTDPGKAFGKTLDMAVGYSVKDQVCRAYRFLTKYWEPDDKIFIIGFSRGSYSARALAGMIHALGLVRTDLEHLDELGWSVYSGADFRACSNFRFAFSRTDQIKIHFLGVWDTVSTFGRITNLKTLPYTADNPSVKNIRHAVAIDEKRVCFKANLFRPDDVGQHDSFEQIWFAGAHCDVGGGYPENESGLAKIALEWMYQEAQKLDCKLDSNQIDFFMGRGATSAKFGQCPADPTTKIHHSIKGFWHFLEFLPRRQWSHEANREGMRWHMPNFYRARKIPDGSIFHPSVQTKLKNDSTYSPKNLPKN